MQAAWQKDGSLMIRSPSFASACRHVNMRLGQRPITRQMIIDAATCYEIAEAYPDDKYSPSHLLLGRTGEDAFHVSPGTDGPGRNVRVVTAYFPSPEEWEPNLKTRRRSP